MADLRIIISGDVKNLTLSLNKATKSVDKFSRNSKRAFGGLGKSLGGVTKMLGPLGIAGAMAGLTIVAIKAAKAIIKFDGALTRVAIQANISNKQQMELRDTIGEVAMETGTSRDELVKAADAIIQRTGRFDLVADNLRLIGVAAAATGGSAEDMGAIVAGLGQNFGFSSKQMDNFMNLLTAQGKMGAFTLQDLATQSERVLAAATTLGATSEKDLGFFTGLMQIGRKATSSSEMTAQAFENLASEITKKSDIIKKKTGFSVIDTEASKKEGVTVFKDVRSMMYGLMEATGGDQKKLAELFGNRSMRVVRAMALMWRKEGVEGFEKFATAGGASMDGLSKDMDRFNQSTSGRMKRLGQIFEVAADKALAPALNELSKELEAFMADEENIRALMDLFKGLGNILMGTAKATVYLIKKWQELAGVVAQRTILEPSMMREIERARDLGLISPEEMRAATMSTAASKAASTQDDGFVRTTSTAISSLGDRSARGENLQAQVQGMIGSAAQAGRANTTERTQDATDRIFGGGTKVVIEKIEVTAGGVTLPVKKTTVTPRRGDRAEAIPGAGR